MHEVQIKKLASEKKSSLDLSDELLRMIEESLVQYKAWKQREEKHKAENKELED